MQLSRTPPSQGWGLPSWICESEPRWAPRKPEARSTQSSEAAPPPVSGQGGDARTLVWVREQLPVHPSVRARATGLQDWGMGFQTGTPPQPPAMGFCSFTLGVLLSHPCGASSSVLQGLADHTPPEAFGLEYRGTKGSRWYLNHASSVGADSSWGAPLSDGNLWTVE